ncbi:NAD(P)/FAD-dependent oxidoreductase [Ruminococcus hominis]|uniref:NAD(P)/FAD-dependent oxidoreductase n=1 Tax=Ruminococcus hominis TaxID=2763065 RepID=A0ABR7G8A2_9FIRM|nr:NAD(P)/FAD-dependent oxidoreductase [Ruminococcus hominis]MBC5683298.1 NAD(P)/FAD-dependent oxidoreductase [Ruminococcus hominis]
MRHVAVIGGGAAGMMAAITAAREGVKVTILEHKDRIGKKILSTGNGRCNFTNTYQTPACYRSDNRDFAWNIIQKFNVEKTISFFKELGIYPKDRNGYLYPYSDQAAAILEVLQIEIAKLNICVMTEINVLDIQPVKRGIRVTTDKKTITVDSVILACGSKAAPVTGSDGSGYQLAKLFGHRIVPVLPALVQIRCAEKFYKSISGVRVQGTVEIYADDISLASDTGEIQLTNYGISGIPVFQVSRYAAKAIYQKQSVTAVLNFMPDMNKDEFLSFLQERITLCPHKTLDEFFTGIFPKKLCELWIRLSRLPKEMRVSDLSGEQLEKLVLLIQHLRTHITETNAFEQAQICCGGVDTTEINPDTLESNYVPGIYFAGELLDVDGICGGYNLQWAWSSGFVAGREAAGNASN